jgi:hypothetical protein
MIDQHLSDTQPVQVSKPASRSWMLLWVLLAAFLVGGMVFAGGFLGYRSGSAQVASLQVMDNLVGFQEQYYLGIQDFREGRYDLARQRFEYVIANDPGYPGAANRLEEVMRILLVTATATPSPIPATITPTPTQDFSSVEEIYQRAQDSFANGDWDAVIDTCTALRREDPTYHVVDVDSLLYRALQSRGVDKIRKASNLEGGIYDLTLAEKFGPLDAIAQGWRNLARIYLIGSSFWEVYPEQAVYFFGQVAAGAPYLRDASGWTALERYRASLIHYGNQLATQGQWCAAQEQYALALAMRDDTQIQVQATDVSYQCALPTYIAATQTYAPSQTATGAVPTFDATWTVTPTGFPTLFPSQSPTATQINISTPTLTTAPLDTVTPQPTPSETPTPPPDQSQ